MIASSLIPRKRYPILNVVVQFAATLLIAWLPWVNPPLTDACAIGHTSAPSSTIRGVNLGGW